MNEPIDIKTKQTIPQIKDNFKFDKSLVLENLELNILTHWDTWGKFQQTWTNSAYKTFKDLDKYIVMMYLLRNYWQNLSGCSDQLSGIELNATNLLEDINQIMPNCSDPLKFFGLSLSGYNVISNIFILGLIIFDIKNNKKNNN